jgi:hypothetical protein
MNTFKIGNKINPKWEININDLTITSGCRFWRYNTLEELLEAIDLLKKEIEETNGEE